MPCLCAASEMEPITTLTTTGSLEIMSYESSALMLTRRQPSGPPSDDEMIAWAIAKGSALSTG